MSTTRTRYLVAAALAVTLAASSAFAQQMKTDIPPSITTPDVVETRLGTLSCRPTSGTPP